MSVALHLAKAEDLPALTGLVAAFHEEMGIAQTEPAREAALRPLLEGSPYGAAYLIGLARAPVGYIVVTFSWSVEFGGLEGTIDEFYIRPKVRGRGMGLRALESLVSALEEVELCALSLEVDREDPHARGLYKRLHFEARERYLGMSRVLPAGSGRGSGASDTL